MRKQRAVITFTDGPKNIVTMHIDFTPSVKNKPVKSRAVQAALEVLRIFSELPQIKRTKS